MARKGPRPQPVMKRIWAHTERVAMGYRTACYVWRGATTSGYGRIKVGSVYDGTRRQASVTRVAYEILVGKIPAGLEPGRLCGTRACWRPDHLELGTKRDNALRGMRRARGQV